MITPREWEQITGDLVSFSGWNISGERFIPLFSVLQLLSGHTEVRVEFELKHDRLITKVFPAEPAFK